MSGFSISGLASNIDTASLITQMMQINAMPQQLLKNQQTATKTAIAAYQNINSKFQALEDAAHALSDFGSFNATTATSSDPTVTTATTSSVSQTGSATFSVVQAATSASSISTTRWNSTSDAFTLTNPITIYDANGAAATTVTVTGQNGAAPTLADAVSALNKASYKDTVTGVVYNLSAGAVQTANGQWALQVNAESSGKAANFTLGATGEFNQVFTGQDAILQVGNSPTATTNPGYDVTSSTNTFTNLLPGVNVSIDQTTPVGKNITVTVAQDVAGLSKKMQTLVDAVNALHDEINTDTGQGTNTDGTTVNDPTAPLSGDFQVQQLYSNLLQQVGSLVTTSSGTTGVANDVGITTDKNGALTFHPDVFAAALQNNPSLTSDLVGGSSQYQGIAYKLAQLADNASNPVDGTLTQTINSDNSLVSDLQDSIDNWQVRLDDMKTNLTERFNAMESALQQLQAQQQWMTSMFASSFGSSGASTTKSNASVSSG